MEEAMKARLWNMAAAAMMCLALVCVVGCQRSEQSSSSTESSSPTDVSDSAHAERKQVDVPDVVGMTSDEAHATLWALNLVDEIMTADGKEIDASSLWKVVKQNPEGGKLAQEGNVVKLIVEGSSAATPDVVGMRADRAEETLAEAGLGVNLKSDDGRTVILLSNWTVVNQDPSSGTEVAAGDTVTLIVHKDEEDEPEERSSDSNEAVYMPDLVGMQCDDAKKALKKIDVDFEIVSDNGKSVIKASNWTVIRQEPSAGTKIEKGETVVLTVSKD